jgi:hypothetical protein
VSMVFSSLGGSLLMVLGSRMVLGSCMVLGWGRGQARRAMCGVGRSLVSECDMCTCGCARLMMEGSNRQSKSIVWQGLVADQQSVISAVVLQLAEHLFLWWEAPL